MVGSRKPWEEVGDDVRKELFRILGAVLGGGALWSILGWPKGLGVTIPALIAFVALLIRIAWPAIQNLLPSKVAAALSFAGWAAIGAAVIYGGTQYQRVSTENASLSVRAESATEIQRRMDEQQRAYSALAVQLGMARQEASDTRDKIRELAANQDAKAIRLRADADMADLIQEGEDFEIQFDGMNPTRIDPLLPQSASRVRDWHDRTLKAIDFHFGPLGLKEFKTQSEDNDWLRSAPWDAQERAAKLLYHLRMFLKVPGFGNSNREAPIPIR